MKSNMTIDRALRDPRLLGAALGDASTWGVWLTILSAAFGEPLGEGEEAVDFAKLAGGRAVPVQRVSELWAVGWPPLGQVSHGRRAGGLYRHVRAARLGRVTPSRARA